ncbi:hypothetical protein [Dactylosporangium sp. CS-033363]|uniref:hypothetical protein n=1 Tax=Dactylosporangium sp. CS-033363 TaxID=3239935 RepID=UPI003D8A3F0E
MSFMDGVHGALAIMGLGALYFGCHVLLTGKVPGGGITAPAEVRRYGVGFLLFSGFPLLQVVGYLGTRLGLWPQTVRGLLLLAGFALGVTVLVKFRPVFSLTRFRRPGGDIADHHD